MLDNLQSLFKNEFQFTHLSAIVQNLANMAHIVKTDFTKDSDAKNAAIDAICHILQGFKDPISIPVTLPVTDESSHPISQ